jgi:hypothetical protein
MNPQTINNAYKASFAGANFLGAPYHRIATR